MSESQGRVEIRQEQGILLLKIIPYRITEYELAEAIGRELIDAVEAAGSTKVVVDLGNVEYMSSVGYGPLITLRSRVRQNGGRLVLARMTPILKEMFEATRLLINPNSPKSLFEYTESLEEAAKLLRGS